MQQNFAFLSLITITLAISYRLFMRIIYLLPFIFMQLVGISLPAQTSINESSAYQNAVHLYHHSLTPESGLYNGIAYIDYAYTLQEGTPFSDLVPFAQGTVVYNHILYENVFIAFDIVKQMVVIYDAQHIEKIVLNEKGISRFATSGHTYVHLTKDSASANDMRAGFYEILYNGNTRVLKKETRSVQESLYSSGPTKKYIIGKADYFVLKDNGYHSVNSKAALLSLLKNKDKELNRWMKKKKLKFNRDKDEALAQAAAWYDENIHE